MSVYLDTNIIIYLVERHPSWVATVAARLSAVRSAGESFSVSDLSRMECQVGPLSNKNQALLDDFAQFFASPDVRLLPITPAAWDRAARLRADHRLKPLDAIHLAVAIEGGCTLFLTNDTRLKDFPEIKVEALS